MIQPRRRQLLLAGLASPALALAQSGPKSRMVVLYPGDSEEDEPATRYFFEELRRRGWIEGSTISFQRLSGRGARRYLEQVATEASGHEPALVFATTGSLAQAVMKDNPALPVVFLSAIDPVSSGLVDTHAVPGRSATGVHQLSAPDAQVRTLEIVREIDPSVRRIGVFFDRHAAEFEAQKQAWQEASAKAGIELRLGEFQNFEAVHRLMVEFRKDNLAFAAIPPSLTMLARRREVVSAATRNRIALVARRSEWPEAGALFSYGTEVAESQRRAAAIADRILRGAKPAQIPVERTMKQELVLNAKTARAMGFTLPRSVLLRADRLVDA